MQLCNPLTQSEEEGDAEHLAELDGEGQLLRGLVRVVETAQEVEVHDGQVLDGRQGCQQAQRQAQLHREVGLHEERRKISLSATHSKGQLMSR